MGNFLREFPTGVEEHLGYYVYRYADPRDGEIFYIGKGVGNRIFAHLNEADDHNRNNGKVRRIRSIWNDGQDVSLIVHRHSLDETQALHVEASLIDLFPDATNEVEGHHSKQLGAMLVQDVVYKYAASPAQIDFPAVLINIRRQWDWVKASRTATPDQKQLYNSTRTAWKINPRAHPQVKHALSCAHGIVRQVYEIESWKEATEGSRGETINMPGRWMFEGRVAEDKAQLIGTSIAHLQKPGAQNAIRWLDKGALE